MQMMLSLLVLILIVGGTNQASAQLSPQSQLLLKQASKAYNVDYSLLVAIAMVESSGKPNAVNKRTKDYGLMQINHKTAVAYGYKPEEMLNKHKSVLVAAKLLQTLQQKFGHEPTWACRYNLGWRKNVPNWSSCHQYIAKLEKAGYTAVITRAIAQNGE